MFLDRDGTINKYVGFLRDIEDFELIDGINESSFLCIVVTNQPVIARGEMTVDCRKPKPGLLLRAAEDFNIDLEKSWMIGDGKNDVNAGQAAGCRTVLIGEAEGLNPDILANNLLGAVESILGKCSGSELPQCG